MPNVINIKLPLLGDPDGAEDSQVFWFDGDDLDPHDLVVRVWRLALAMAVRDEATSLSYHPWDASGVLTYVAQNIRYELVPPPDDWAVRLVAAAGVLLRGNGAWARVRARRGRRPDGAGRVRLLSAGRPSDWAGVVWSAPGIAGVEWHRLDRPAALAWPQSAR